MEENTGSSPVATTKTFPLIFEQAIPIADMPTYQVKITAKVTKTVEVEADNEDEAIEAAHENFTVACEGDEEDYEQETDEVTMVS